MSATATKRVIEGGYTVETVSKPGAAMRVERIVLTKEQKKRLTLHRLPGGKTGVLRSKDK